MIIIILNWDNAIAPSILIPQWTMKDPTNSSKFSVDTSVDSSAVRITIDMNTSTMSIKRFHQLGVMGLSAGTYIIKLYTNVTPYVLVMEQQ